MSALSPATKRLVPAAFVPAALALTSMLAGCQSGDLASASTVPVAAQPGCPEGARESRAVLTGEETTLTYTACADRLRVTGEDFAADLFYTAYLAPGAEGATRPIAFIWNGGPGADSRLLHFEALGPRTLQDGRIANNAASPLPAADLVFLDPAGTGFSRARDEASAKRLYSTTGDIAATTRFITTFLERTGRSNSPVYLAGESFGTWRAAAVAEALADEGQPVAGIALISGGIPMGEERDRSLMRALSLPNRTATALALGKLATDLAAAPEETIAAAEEWARRVWRPALADPQALNQREREEVVSGLARFTGLAASDIDTETLWISPKDFRTRLMAAEGRTLGIFDMRKTTEDEARDDAAADAATAAYYRQTLGYTEGTYAGIESEALPVGRSWQYDQAPITKESLARAMAGEGPPSPSQPWVLHALEKLPAMRVFVATGLYDSLNSCAGNRAAAADFPPALAARIEAHCYRGGHMMYEVPSQAVQFAADLSAFFGNSTIPEN